MLLPLGSHVGAYIRNPTVSIAVHPPVRVAQRLPFMGVDEEGIASCAGVRAWRSSFTFMDERWRIGASQK